MSLSVLVATVIFIVMYVTKENLNLDPTILQPYFLLMFYLMYFFTLVFFIIWEFEQLIQYEVILGKCTETYDYICLGATG